MTLNETSFDSKLSTNGHPNDYGLDFADDRTELEEPPQVSDIFKKTDLHGFPDLYDSYTHKKKLKALLWLIICVVAVVVLVYMIHKSVADFNDNPIITGYDIVVDDKGVPFPTVIICPQNAIHQQNLINANVNETWMEENFKSIFGVKELNNLRGILASKSNIQNVISGGGSAPPAEADDIYNPFSQEEEPQWTPKDAVDFLMKVGYEPDQLFKECAFRSLGINPCSKIITSIFDPNKGKCFEVKLEPGQAFQTDERNGLSLVLNMDSENADPKSYQQHEIIPSLFNGVEVKLTMGAQTIESTIAATKVPKGSYADLSMEATKMQLITIRNQKCYEEHEVEGILRFHTGAYSQALCKFDCGLQALHDKCNCIIPIDPNYLRKSYNTSVFCAAHKRIKDGCVATTINDEKYRDAVKQCFSKCHKPCNLWQVRLTTATSTLPGGNSNDAGKNGANPNYDDMSQETSTAPPGICTLADLPLGEFVNGTHSNGDTYSYLCVDDPVNECTRNGTIYPFGVTINDEQCADKENEGVIESTVRPTCRSKSLGNSDCDSEGKSNKFRYNIDTDKCEGMSYDCVDMDNGEFTFYKREKCEIQCRDNCNWLELRQTTTGIDYCGPSFNPGTNLQGFKPNRQLGKCVETSESNCGHTMMFYTNLTECEQTCFSSETIPIVFENKEEWYTSNENRFKRQDTNEEPPPESDVNPRDMIVLDISYSTIEYISMNQQPSMTFASFVGSVGGHVGLFLGASIISCFKFFIIVAPLVYSWAKSLRN